MNTTIVKWKILQSSFHTKWIVATKFRLSLLEVFLSRSSRAVFLRGSGSKKFRESLKKFDAVIMACFGKFFKREARSYDLSSVQRSGDENASRSVSQSSRRRLLGGFRKENKQIR